jgi:flagellar biosynthesis protein FlhF
MKIKRYIGKDTQEALLKVKMDLGNNAIILNTKKIRQKGIKRFFTNSMIEVMAAIDDDNVKMRERELTKIVPDADSTASQKNILSQKEEKASELENKVNNIENLLDRILNIVKIDNKNVSNQREEDNKKLPQIFQLLYNNLLKNEVDQEIAKDIIEQVEKRSNARDINDASLVMHSVISSMLGKAEPINFRKDGKPTVILFVGPTGVGKTTTLAKLAATFMLSYNKKIGLITADTYRISAVDQLKTYAEILGIPITVAYSVLEIKNEIEKYSDKDVILIDTAGCSYRDKQKFDELKNKISKEFESIKGELFTCQNKVVELNVDIGSLNEDLVSKISNEVEGVTSSFEAFKEQIIEDINRIQGNDRILSKIEENNSKLEMVKTALWDEINKPQDNRQV